MGQKIYIDKINHTRLQNLFFGKKYKNKNLHHTI